MDYEIERLETKIGNQALTGYSVKSADYTIVQLRNEDVLIRTIQNGTDHTGLLHFNKKGEERNYQLFANIADYLTQYGVRIDKTAETFLKHEENGAFSQNLTGLEGHVAYNEWDHTKIPKETDEYVANTSIVKNSGRAAEVIGLIGVAALFRRPTPIVRVGIPLYLAIEYLSAISISAINRDTNWLRDGPLYSIGAKLVKETIAKPRLKKPDHLFDALEKEIKTYDGIVSPMKKARRARNVERVLTALKATDMLPESQAGLSLVTHNAPDTQKLHADILSL